MSAAAAPSPAPATAGATNPSRTVRVIKVVVNAGVGQSGEARTKAERVLQMVTRQKPTATRSKATNRDFGIRQGQEIGAKVTLRGPAAQDFLVRAFDARDRQLDPDSIDRTGNVSFGVSDYTDFAGMKYDPEIGLVGFDVCIEVGRIGWRIRARRERTVPLPHGLRVSRDETRAFLADRFKVVYLE
ncbi:MAG: 50S ribosomal protein L5 [Thermoplasmata archaeon]